MIQLLLLAFHMPVLLVMHFHHKLIGKVISQSTEIFQLGEVIADADGMDNRSISQLAISFFAENIFNKIVFNVW